MAKNLVIVESPAKVKTIKKFLGTNYEVVASQGHVRDLPKSSLGIDIENNYEPKYITIRGKGEILAKLRKEVKKADKIYLATDPDREGEAISWHLYEALKLSEKKVARISFNEITKNAVKESIKNAREIDMNLVDAQQARRILDRMVGYRISPLLWSKIKRGLSAGRVQSVALRMICDREAEISAFIPKEYWTMDANLLPAGTKKPFTAHFYADENGKKTIDNAEEADRIEKILKGATFEVKESRRGERTRKAPLPFTTSTLQQEASKALNFSTKKTMQIAQQLYEGVTIKGQGTTALISYLRTDSTRVSDFAKEMAKEYIQAHYGEEFLSADYKADAAKKAAAGNTEHKIQDAHEAIRPTDINNTPDKVKGDLSRDQYRLYNLIWKRFAASRMSAATFETLSVKLDARKIIFTASASAVKFEGFMKVYADEERDNDNGKAENAFLLKEMNEKSTITFESLEKKKHFTQPPAHFTEASLVRALEEQGIGRPSTYAPTISTILARRYILKENKNLFVSELGEIVNKVMKDEFPAIVDPKFTANMESMLDSVGEGNIKWKTIIENFYPDLDAAVLKAEEEMAQIEIKDEESDVVCEKCGRNMVIKYGPHGRFLACPGFPECQNTKPYFEKIGVKCPKCDGEIVIRMTKKGRRYFGCENIPTCDFMSWNRPVDEKCPRCGGLLVEKGNRLCCMDEQCGFIKDKPVKNNSEE
ncbi:DNA topoisomerase-1 [Lachnospiraceae bacterium XPB1003]|nr:DNA topoisomerase-1 [Lachnospiraceae bacterium XPB1003]